MLDIVSSYSWHSPVWENACYKTLRVKADTCTAEPRASHAHTWLHFGVEESVSHLCSTMVCGCLAVPQSEKNDMTAMHPVLHIHARLPYKSEIILEHKCISHPFMWKPVIPEPQCLLYRTYMLTCSWKWKWVKALVRQCYTHVQWCNFLGKYICTAEPWMAVLMSEGKSCQPIVLSMIICWRAINGWWPHVLRFMCMTEP